MAVRPAEAIDRGVEEGAEDVDGVPAIDESEQTGDGLAGPPKGLIDVAAMSRPTGVAEYLG
jgi:hypothetical protein